MSDHVPARTTSVTKIIYRGADGTITKTGDIYTFVNGNTTVSGRSERELYEADINAAISAYALLHVTNDELNG